MQRGDGETQLFSAGEVNIKRIFSIDFAASLRKGEQSKMKLTFQNKIQKLVVTGVFTAVLAVLSQLSIPMPSGSGHLADFLR